MGATSVTGVGQGGVGDGLNKGSQHNSLSSKKLIGAHVVAAGKQTLSGTTGVIDIVEQTGVVGDYCVLLTNNSSTHAYVSTALAAIADTDVWAFTVTAGSGDVVQWALVKTGM